jgi:predicted O-methyltransferase YrrM
MAYPPGHFYSPIPALKEIKKREAEIFAIHPSMPGIDLRPERQLQTMSQLTSICEDQPFSAHPKEGLRYYFDNGFFPAADGLVLHAMLRLNRPRRLIEVGSGFSSALVLDTNDLFLDGELTCTFIDPYPDRLLGLLRDEDRARHRVVSEPVQNVPLELFDDLEAGDILFIDSSHVSKVGSDVNRLVFDVLPRLHPGVLIHFHDVFYPFEYPAGSVFSGRAWNEDYILRAFLMFNTRFDIEIFNGYLGYIHGGDIAPGLPNWNDQGGSLWLRRSG